MEKPIHFIILVKVHIFWISRSGMLHLIWDARGSSIFSLVFNWGKILSGLEPNGQFYHWRHINAAIKLAIGHVIAIECNLGLTADSQFYRVHICVDKSGSDFIDCPINLTEISETTCSSSTKWSGYDTDSVLEERSAYSWARK